MDIYVVVINGEVATVAQMDEATLAKVRAMVENEPSVTGNIVGPLAITTNPVAIEAEVEEGLDLWRM